MITISYDTTDYKTMYLPELLQRIEDITGIPAAQMSVSGNGKLLQEGRKIGDYYGGGCTLPRSVVVRLFADSFCLVWSAAAADNISPGTTISVMLKLPKKEAAKDADSSKDADKADS